MQRHGSVQLVALACCLVATMATTTQAFSQKHQGRREASGVKLQSIRFNKAPYQPARSLLLPQAPISLTATATLATETAAGTSKGKPIDTHSFKRKHVGNRMMLSAVETVSSKPIDPEAQCPLHHYRNQCHGLKGCMWCINKFSPWPGSDGVCIAKEDAWELPSWTYTCLDDVPHVAAS